MNSRGAPHSVYPARPAQRTRWILAQRPARPALDPLQPVGVIEEVERADNGELVSVATVFLANRECPWRCLMCDLWKNALRETVPPGAIPAQIDQALGRLAKASGALRSPSTLSGRRADDERDGTGRSRHIKLYNAGSFFDPKAIPPGDYPAVAQRLIGFERVIVECHPALVGDAAVRFKDLLANQGRRGPDLEVALGLETVHPDVLPRLNKRMSLERFASSAQFLVRHGIAVRAFVLVKPPFVAEVEAVDWAVRSLEFAFDHGARVVCLIPTRGGNGALERLAANGEFAPPRLATLEAALAAGLHRQRGRVFADLWDLRALADCPACFPARRARLEMMNRTQQVLEPVGCRRCGAMRVA